MTITNEGLFSVFMEWRKSESNDKKVAQPCFGGKSMHFSILLRQCGLLSNGHFLVVYVYVYVSHNVYMYGYVCMFVCVCVCVCKCVLVCASVCKCVLVCASVC